MEPILKPFETDNDSRLMLEVAFRTFDEYKDAKKQLDMKTSIILASNGVLFGFVANFIIEVGQAHNMTPVIFSLFFTAIGLSLSIYCCVMALQNREFQDFQLNDFLEKIKKTSYYEGGLPFQIYDRIGSYIGSYVKNLEIMGNYYEKGLYALILSIITGFISISSLFIL